MPAKRTSLFIPDRIMAGLHLPDREAVRGDNDRAASMSGRINQQLDWFAWIVASSLPSFSKDEWCAIFEANNGTLIDFRGDEFSSSFTGVWANVDDCRGLSEKWNIDPKKLVAKLRDLDVPQQAAVCEMIERFWANPQIKSGELLKKIGIIPSAKAPAGVNGNERGRAK